MREQWDAAARDFMWREQQRRMDREYIQLAGIRAQRQEKLNKQAEKAGERIAKAGEQPHQEWDAKQIRTTIEMDGKEPIPVLVSLVYTPLGTTTEVDFLEQSGRIRFDNDGVSAFQYEIVDGDIVKGEAREVTFDGVSYLTRLAEQLEQA